MLKSVKQCRPTVLHFQAVTMWHWQNFNVVLILTLIRALNLLSCFQKINRSQWMPGELNPKNSCVKDIWFIVNRVKTAKQLARSCKLEFQELVKFTVIRRTDTPSPQNPKALSCVYFVLVRHWKIATKVVCRMGCAVSSY